MLSVYFCTSGKLKLLDYTAVSTPQNHTPTAQVKATIALAYSQIKQPLIIEFVFYISLIQCNIFIYKLRLSRHQQT